MGPFKTTDNPSVVELRIGGEDCYQLNGQPGETLRRFSEALAALSPSVREIVIRINAQGGHCNIGIGIFDMLRRWRGRVVTSIEPVAWSTGAILSQVGAHRRIAANGIIGPHKNRMTIDLSIVPGGTAYYTTPGLRLYADAVDQGSRVIAKIFAKRTGRSMSEVNALLDKDTCLNAREALAWGLVDEIGPPYEGPVTWGADAGLALSQANAAWQRLRAQDTATIPPEVRLDGPLLPWQQDDLGRLRAMVAEMTATADRW
jgi:ATP-dependent protease ClpP protease subunit